MTDNNGRSHEGADPNWTTLSLDARGARRHADDVSLIAAARPARNGVIAASGQLPLLVGAWVCPAQEKGDDDEHAT